MRTFSARCCLQVGKGRKRRPQYWGYGSKRNALSREVFSGGLPFFETLSILTRIVKLFTSDTRSDTRTRFRRISAMRFALLTTVVAIGAFAACGKKGDQNQTPAANPPAASGAAAGGEIGRASCRERV